MTLKYCRRRLRTIEAGKWHRMEINREWVNFKHTIKAYMAFLCKELTGKVKKVIVQLLPEPEPVDCSGIVIITNDTMDPTKSMADGKYYTSKKKMEREQRAQGYVHVGNDKQEHLKQDEVLAKQAHFKDIKQVVERVIDG